jgi:UMF1 family MFS transporter
LGRALIVRGAGKTRRQVIAWALYDWGNSAFATAVIAGFFPIFFKQYWSAGIDPTASSFRLGIANSAGSLVVLALAPALGAVADQGAFKKRFLTAFAFAGIVATAALYLVEQGSWEIAVLLYVVAGIGFSGANVFYDALLIDVAEAREFDFVSGLGYAAGYLGGGLFFAGCVALTLWPESFGLAGRAQAVSLSFVLTGVWWALFTLPLLRAVRERPATGSTGFLRALGGGFRQLAATFRKIRRFRVVVLFLVAYWLYIDGVDTIVRMAVDYGMALGFPAEGLITALLITQFVGFPAALLFGWLGGKIGAKTGILIGIAAYMAITFWGYLMQSSWEFYALAVAIGLVQGGVQSLSRSLYARLIPEEAAAEFFGFYNLLGKFAAVLGPALMGWVAVATGSNRLSILSLLVLFGLGALLLLFVKPIGASLDPDAGETGAA